MTRTLAPVTRTALVRCSPERAFEAFTVQIAGWWPLSTHSVYGGDAATVGFVEGQIVERSNEGRTNVWGQVLTWEPPDQLSFTWHPGRDDGQRTQVTVTFRPEGDGTRVDLEHIGWEVFGEDAEATRATYDGAKGWTGVFTSFAAHFAA